MWTRNSLLYHLKITEVILKRIIHHVAYFFCNGPWNRCWVKYGYDPRADPKSKIYQIVDYRVRAILDPEKNLVKSRTSRAYHRSSSVLFYSFSIVNILLFFSLSPLKINSWTNSDDNNNVDFSIKYQKLCSMCRNNP